MTDNKYVSRGGIKLEHALDTFNVRVQNLVVLDVGSSTGGFVDCLLQHGAKKVYSIDTAYGELAWKLRQDPRVVVMERKNILDITDLPEPIDLITIDVTFTSLTKILPAVKNFLKPDGKIIALLKPQYEDQALALKNRGVIPAEFLEKIVDNVVGSAQEAGYKILGKTDSPITGKDGNTEYLIYLSI